MIPKYLQKNSGKFLLLFSIFFLLITPNLANAIYSQYSQIPTKVFELDKTIPQENVTMKGIVVVSPTRPNKPKLLKKGEIKNDKKLSNIVRKYDGNIAFTSKYGHSYIDVPEENYEAIITKLRAVGYKVRDELILQPMLDESLVVISAPYTWYSSGQELTLTGNNRVIAILDTGIDDTHSDLQGKVLAWRDSIEIVDNENYGSITPYDDNGHGTFVSSIAVGTGEASSGQYTGVAPGANLLVARVCGPVYNWGYLRWECRERYLEDALQWIIDLFDSGAYQADVISMSLGASNPEPNKCTDMNSGMNELISDAISRGIPVVAAAGNDGPANDIKVGGIFEGAITWPACVQDVIAVGATYKKAYQGYSFGLDIQERLLVSTKVHVKIDWVDPDGIARSDEYEWEAFNASWSGLYEKSGFDKVINPGPYTEDVWVSYEVMERVIGCHLLFGCPHIDEIWYPSGSEEKGVAYFGRQCYVPFGYDNQMVVQFSAWPMVEEIPGILGWTYYHTYFPRYEPEPGIHGEPKGININCYKNIHDWELMTDFIPFWSSRGPPPQGGIMKPDVVAPGYHICAAHAENTEIGEDICGNDQYTAAMGTSASTPFVSGLIALLKEAKPNADINLVKDSIFNTADDVCGVNGYDGYWNDKYSCAGEGHGRINVQKAVDYITDCSLKDGWNCNRNSREYWDYYYDSESGSCTYSITANEDCRVDASDSDGGLAYKTRGTCTDYTGCLNGNCQSSSYTDVCAKDATPDCRDEPFNCPSGNCKTLGFDSGKCFHDVSCNPPYLPVCEVDCVATYGSGWSCAWDPWYGCYCKKQASITAGHENYVKEYYVSGTGDSTTCSYTYKNCKDYGTYWTCSDGRCVYTSSDGGGGGGGGPPRFTVK